MVYELVQYPVQAVPVGTSADWVEPVWFEAWVTPTDRPVLPVEYRHRLEWLTAPDFEPVISTPDLVGLLGWLPPTERPVLPVEYRHLVPAWFYEPEPDALVAAAGGNVSPHRATLANDGANSAVQVGSRNRAALGNSGQNSATVA